MAYLKHEPDTRRVEEAKTTYAEKCGQSGKLRSGGIYGNVVEGRFDVTTERSCVRKNIIITARPHGHGWRNERRILNNSYGLQPDGCRSAKFSSCEAAIPGAERRTLMMKQSPVATHMRVGPRTGRLHVFKCEETKW